MMKNEKKQIRMSERSRSLLEAYARDAINWSGCPCVGGNVGGSASDRGNLIHLKRAGLIETSRSDGCTWIHFTGAGRAFCVREFGVDPTPRWVEGGGFISMTAEEARSWEAA